MKVHAEKCLLGELAEGEMFSYADQNHWDLVTKPTGLTTQTLHRVGHAVYLRSCEPIPDDIAQAIVWRIRVERDGGAPETRD